MSVHVDKNVISVYSPKAAFQGGKASPADRLASVIMEIMAYIMDHQKLSRASILNDLSFPESGDNSDLAWMGLKDTLARILNHDTTKNEKFAVWSVIGSIHEAFLRPDVFRARNGLALENEKDRLSFAKYLAGILIK